MSDSNALTVQQRQAIELRDVLFTDRVKNQLEIALPKWLTVDRLLRVVYSSVLKNPKLLQCTQDSLLNAIMQCAQLGLEPILGRAHFVPYKNKKKKGEPLECQFQPGYQGLIDLARRSGTISDVWGACVYENDKFELNYGMDRTLSHVPWYMTSETRADGPGKVIGAYVVWLLKDGTKHPEFMPIHEIHKRREQSQAYRWAETGDRNKGGGKKDSIWHKWPEDQCIKTVIKHSAKMVPASIDFMSAVQVDTDVDVGQYVQQPFSFGDPGEVPQIAAPDEEKEETPFTTDDFDSLIPKGTDTKSLDLFIAELSKFNNVDSDVVKTEAVANMDEFMATFNKWAASQKKKQTESKETVADQMEDTPDYGILNKKNWNGMGIGYPTFVFKNIKAIEAAPQEVQKEMEAKWGRVVKSGDPWPLSPVSEEKHQESMPTSSEGEYNPTFPDTFRCTPAKISSAIRVLIDEATDQTHCLKITDWLLEKKDEINPMQFDALMAYNTEKADDLAFEA